MLNLDMIKRRLKLKRTLLETKVKEYERAAEEVKRAQENLQARAEFITTLTEEIGQLEHAREQAMAARGVVHLVDGQT